MLWEYFNNGENKGYSLNVAIASLCVCVCVCVCVHLYSCISEDRYKDIL